MKKVDLDYLVTGTGRCGTVFCARFLTSLGIQCGHESIFDYRGIKFALAKLYGGIKIVTSECSQYEFKDGLMYPLEKWLFESNIIAESSYMAAPFIKHDCLKKVKIIHVIRNPMSVINSFCNYINYFQHNKPSDWFVIGPYERFIFQNVPELQSELNPFERCALYYVRWNQMIENNSKDHLYIRHRIEDSKDELFDFLNIEKNKDYFDDKVNSFDNGSKSIDVLNYIKNPDIWQSLLDISCRYGYSIDYKLI